METQKRKRLPDLSEKERFALYHFIGENKENPNLLDLIYKNFGIKYRQSSLKYVKNVSHYSSNPEKIKEDNQMMSKWAVDSQREKSNYADLLYDLANNNITSDEFAEMVKNDS